MEIETKYELPMLTSTIKDEPHIVIENMDIVVGVEGWNLKDEIKKVKLIFKSVLCHVHTSERFTKELLSAYDAVVEIKNSNWLKDLQEWNVRDFDFWKPRHFAVYFDGVGMYQFIAQEFEAYEYD